MSGVTAQGFDKKTFETIRTEIINSAQGIWGSGLNLEDSTPDGVMVNIISEAIADLWDVAEETYNAFFPSQATDANLSALVEINKIVRRVAAPTQVELSIVGVVGTTVPAGFLVSNVSGLTEVKTLAIHTCTGGVDLVDSVCTETGPVDIPLETMTVQVNTNSGIISVINTADGILGNDAETDAQLRYRRELSILKPSTSVVEAITADVINLDGVTHATTYENDTNNGGDIEPNSIMALVNGGDPTEIAYAINNNKPAGVPTTGTSSAIVTDSQGVSKIIYFQRPTEVPIYITANLSIINAKIYPGDEAIKDAIIEYVELYSSKVGDDVIYSRMYQPFNYIPGHQVDSLFIGKTISPTGTVSVPISFKEISMWDKSRIIINS